MYKYIYFAFSVISLVTGWGVNNTGTEPDLYSIHDRSNKFEIY